MAQNVSTKSGLNYWIKRNDLLLTYVPQICHELVTLRFAGPDCAAY